MSSQTQDIQPNVTFGIGHQVQLIGGPYVGHRGVIQALDNHVYVILENGVHLHGNYTLFKKID